MHRRTILFYTHAFAGGGAERVFTQLASAFAAAGDTVVFAADFDQPDLEAPPLNLRRVVLGQGHRRGIADLAAILARDRPDASFSALGAQNVKHLAAAALAGRRDRCVLGYHGFAVAEPKRLSRLAYSGAAILTRTAARSICVSDALLADLRTRWHASRDRTLRIYNPVTPSAAPFRDEAAILALPPLVVACGRLVAVKRFPALVEAFADVEPREARLAILGEGPDRPAIEGAIRRAGLGARVDLPGHVDPWPWYRRARCVAIASASESFGLTAAEALAQGLPVVTTDCGGPAEVLDAARTPPGRFGRIVPLDDQPALSAALTQTLGRPGDPGPRRERAETFALERIYGEYRAVVEALGSRKRRLID